MKVFVRMVKFKKRKRGGKSESGVTYTFRYTREHVVCVTKLNFRVLLFAERAGWTRPTPSRLGKMDVAAGIEGENHDSTSSTSCFNEFET